MTLDFLINLLDLRVFHTLFLRDKKGREWAILGDFWCVVCIKYLYQKSKS